MRRINSTHTKVLNPISIEVQFLSFFRSVELIRADYLCLQEHLRQCNLVLMRKCERLNVVCGAGGRVDVIVIEPWATATYGRGCGVDGGLSSFVFGSLG